VYVPALAQDSDATKSTAYFADICNSSIKSVAIGKPFELWLMLQYYYIQQYYLKQ
jgi:hypothetical protein